MKVRITELEADARELRECQSLGQNLLNMLSHVFQSREPFDDEEDTDTDGGEQE